MQYAKSSGTRPSHKMRPQGRTVFMVALKVTLSATCGTRRDSMGYANTSYGVCKIGK
jgi:hypothetical protein